MSKPITCGPFAATESQGKSYVIFNINTQGDWVGTKEGQAKLRAAQQAVATACERGFLPAETVFEYRDDDSAIVRAPFENWTQAMQAAPAIKELIPSLVGATLTETARHKA